MITTTSEYALRALVHLAQQPKGVLLGGKELSQQLDIPASYLSGRACEGDQLRVRMDGPIEQERKRFVCLAAEHAEHFCEIR